MKTSMKKGKNKVVTLIAGVAVAVMIIGVGLIFTGVFGNGDLLAKGKIDGKNIEALKKVEDVNNTAAVAEFFETMGLETLIGEYRIEIGEEEGVTVLTINMIDPVQEKNKKKFESDMTTCAEQVLDLIPQVERVDCKHEDKTVFSLV